MKDSVDVLDSVDVFYGRVRTYGITEARCNAFTQAKDHYMILRNKVVF